jgi:hypothetical protein
MSLTKAQRRVVDEIESVLRISGYDWREIEAHYEPDQRLGQLERIKLDFMRAKVVGDYVFVDELLTVIIVSYFFPAKDFPTRYSDRKMRTFMHFVMEELFMLRKLALVQEIRNFDSKMVEMIQKLNALRNAMAHSFVPENKRDYRKSKTIVWNKQDINTIKGLQAFDNDMFILNDYLHQMAFGKRMADAIKKKREEAV